MSTFLDIVSVIVVVVVVVVDFGIPENYLVLNSKHPSRKPRHSRYDFH